MSRHELVARIADAKSRREINCFEVADFRRESYFDEYREVVGAIFVSMFLLPEGDEFFFFGKEGEKFSQ